MGEKNVEPTKKRSPMNDVFYSITIKNKEDRYIVNEKTDRTETKGRKRYYVRETAINSRDLLLYEYS